MSDPVADFLTRIRNASNARHRYVEVPASKLKLELARLLKEQGYIDGFLHKQEGPQGLIRLYLRYGAERQPVIRGLRRISKPGCRKYVRANDVPRVLGGMGTAVVSTPQGVLTGSNARERKVGGELMFYVW